MRFFFLLLSSFLVTAQSSPVYGDMRKQYQDQEESKSSLYQKCVAELKSGDVAWIQRIGELRNYESYVIKDGNVSKIFLFPNERSCYWKRPLSDGDSPSYTSVVYGKIGEQWGSQQYEIEDGQLVVYAKVMQLPQTSVKVNRYVLTQGYRRIPSNWSGLDL